MSGRLTITGRADLLRALNRAESASAQHRLGLALGFDFVPPLEEGVQLAGSGVARTSSTASLSVGPPRAIEPLQTSFFALTGYRKLPEPPPDEAEAEKAAKAAAEAVQPLTDKDCEPTGLTLPFQPLVRRERLWPRLRQSLQQRWAAGLDLPKLVGHLSRGELPRSLPARRGSGLTAQVFVLWDAADRLTPYAEDYRRLIAELHHLHGAAGLRLWRVHDGPDDVWGEWAPERVAWPERWPGRPWRKDGTDRGGDATGLPEFPAGSRVLLLSDLGGLARHAAPSRRWLRALRRWRADGVSSTAWVPQGPRWVAPALAAQADEVHCLTPTPQRVRATGQAGDDSLTTHVERHRVRQDELCDELLVRASICIYLEPALLRSLRHTLPALAAEPGLEALAWSRQPVVRSSRVSRALAEEVAPAYRRRFGELPAAEQRAILQRVTDAHAALGRSTPVVEVLTWCAHASEDAVLHDEKALISQAQQWALAWSARVLDAKAEAGTAEEARRFAADLLPRIGPDAAFMGQHSAWASEVWALSGRAVVPAGLEARHADAALRAKARTRGLTASITIVKWVLDLQDRIVRLTSAEQKDSARTYVLLSEYCWIEGSDLGPRAVLGEPIVEPLTLMQAGSPGQTLTFRAQQQELTITELVRPSWAAEWGRDRYGIFATLEVAGVGQRMRWISPGRFHMGSLPDDDGLIKDEGPKHEVTLTQGFWLADTTCIQSMWRAVMGDALRPISFLNHPDFPVTGVSWVAVMDFVKRVQKSIWGGWRLELPTEAEWEYSCRSGTDTAFSFGSSISVDQANFDARIPYGSARIADGRGEPVAVKSLPPNNWGLFEMHGNVWEWCADARRVYSNAGVSDPVGKKTGSIRMIRGGSWNDGAWWARSGHRNFARTSKSDDAFGFRFALKHYPDALSTRAGDNFGRSRTRLKRRNGEE